MITALIIMHLFGGGGLELFSQSDIKTVEQTIEDRSRALATRRAMQRINENLDEMVERKNEVFERLVEIDDAVDSPEQAYDIVLDELDRIRRNAREKYIQDVFIMRRNMTRAEWDAAFGKDEE